MSKTNLIPSTACRLAFVVTGAALVSPSLFAEDALNRIEELTITATRLPRTIENIAGTVSILSDEIIEREIAIDLDDLTRFQPGVTMNTAARGGNQGFSIRGIGGNRVLTVIDGVRSNDIYAAGPSSYGRDSFEIDNLKSVEIIRGPASVLYGADAMGGAVILRSKQAMDYVRADNGSYFNVLASGADADNQSKLGATAAFQFGDFGLLARMTRREFSESDVNGPGSLNPQDGESDNVLLQASWAPAAGHELIASIEVYGEENDLSLLTEQVSPSVNRSAGFDETERHRFGFQYLWQGESALADDLQFIWNQQTTDALQSTMQERTSFSFINPMDPATYGGTLALRETDFEFNQETTAFNLNLRKQVALAGASHSFAYGLNHDRTETERPRNRCETNVSSSIVTCAISAFPFAPPEVFPNKTFPDTETARFGVYFQDEIVIGDSGLTLIPGVRYDRYEMDPNLSDAVSGVGDIANFGGFSVTAVDTGETSLSFGVLYDINDTYSVFAQYAEGYRPPNFDEANQAFVNLGFGYASIPNPSLQAESSQGYELGLRADLDNAYISFAVFHNDYEDFIQSNFVGTQGNINLFQDTNVGAAEIRGAELLANFYLSDDWQLRSSVAYARGDDEANDIPLDSIEPLHGVFALSYTAPGDLWGGEVIVTAVGEKDRVSAPTAVTADSYALVDLLSHVNLSDRATLRLGIFNLFDEQYARWANIQGLDAASVTAIQNAQQPGTNFRAAFSVEF